VKGTRTGLAVAVAALLVGALVAVIAYDGDDRAAPPPTTRAPSEPATFELHKVDEARFSPAPGQPFFVAVLGNDARPGQTISRADALHLVGINPATGRATILNIPRDTYVDIPGGGRDKINAAHARGGPALTAQTMGNLVGVQVSFVLSTGFTGLAAMVDELGGVDVDVPVAMNDSFSGAVFPRGRVHMNGAQALAFSRNRHLGGGDFTRSHDQGILILAALAKLRGEGLNPANIVRWMGVLARHTRLDGVNLIELYRLGRLASAIDPSHVANVTMPGYAGQAGSASVVFVGPGAPALFANFRDDAVV